MGCCGASPRRSYQVGATFLNIFNEIERNIRAIICLGWVRNQQNWEDIVMMIIWNCVQALLIVYTVLLSPMSCKAKKLPKIHHKKPSFPYVFSTNLVGTHVMLIQRESLRSLNQKEQYWWTHLEPLHFFTFHHATLHPFCLSPLAVILSWSATISSSVRAFGLGEDGEEVWAWCLDKSIILLFMAEMLVTSWGW